KSSRGHLPASGATQPREAIHGPGLGPASNMQQICSIPGQLPKPVKPLVIGGGGHDPRSCVTQLSWHIRSPGGGTPGGGTGSTGGGLGGPPGGNMGVSLGGDMGGTGGG